ncbi:hypothetical protein [Thermodesulfovibrio hydrogeniphilus]
MSDTKFITESFKIAKNDLFDYITSEVKSNKNFNELIGYNSINVVESLIKKHLIILEHGIKFGLLSECIRKIMLLYKCHLNLSFQEKYFKLENLVFINAFKTLIPNYSKNLISLYELISSNIDKFLNSDKLYKKCYIVKNDEPFLKILSKILCFEKLEDNQPLQNFLEGKDKKEAIIEFFLPILEKIHNLFIEGIFDEIEAIAILSEIYDLATSQILDTQFKEKPKILVTFPGQFEPIGYFFNYYSYIEVAFISYLLNLKGKSAKFLPLKEIPNFSLINELEKLYIMGVDVYNLEEVVNFFEAHKTNPNFRQCEFIIHGTDFDENTNLPASLKIVHPLKILQE